MYVVVLSAAHLAVSLSFHYSGWVLYGNGRSEDVYILYLVSNIFFCFLQWVMGMYLLCRILGLVDDVLYLDIILEVFICYTLKPAVFCLALFIYYWYLTTSYLESWTLYLLYLATICLYSWVLYHILQPALCIFELFICHILLPAVFFIEYECCWWPLVLQSSPAEFHPVSDKNVGPVMFLWLFNPASESKNSQVLHNESIDGMHWVYHHLAPYFVSSASAASYILCIKSSISPASVVWTGNVYLYQPLTSHQYIHLSTDNSHEESISTAHISRVLSLGHKTWAWWGLLNSFPQPTTLSAQFHIKLYRV